MDEKQFRYQHLAEEIGTKIRNGTYQPGEKLPSIRQLHRRLQLSISTVYQAFVELETVGLIEARPRSGYYVRPVSLKSFRPPVHATGKPAKPRKVELDGMVNSVLTAMHTPGILSMASSATAPALLPFRRFTRILKTLSAAEMEKRIGYGVPQGDAELRRQIARRTLGVMPDASAEAIIITNGCSEAVSLCLQAVLSPGDILAIEAPTHFGFLQLFRELGITVVEIPTHPRDGVDADALEEILKQTPVQCCLFMPNFQNPLGALMSDERKERLVRLLNRREIPVIEDDICGEMFFEGNRRPALLKQFDRKDLVMTCSSFSKTLAPGFRIGWAIPGKRFREKVLRLKAGTTVCTAMLDQYVMARFLADGSAERHLRSLRQKIRQQMTKTALAVEQYFPPGTRLAVPRGGSLLWVQLPRGADGATLYRQALERKIAILPGVVCSVSGQFRDYIRIGCGYPFTPETEEGIRTLGRLLEAPGLPVPV